MARKYVFAAIIVLAIACWFSLGFHQGDEHFQIIEFAGWKLGVVSEAQLAWEFQEQMRPAAQPAIAYLVHKAFGLFGEVNPFHFAFFLRLLSEGFFLLVMRRIWQRYAPLFPNEQLTRWLALGVLFSWCAIYSGVRFSGENWSGLTLALGLLTYPISSPTDAKNTFFTANNSPRIHALLAGLCLGIAFLFRYQVAIMIVGFLGWLLFIKREDWQNFSLVILGGIIAVLFGLILDHWFYGEWVLAPWNYLRVNLIEGVAATFGTAPWWDYFRQVFERGVPPLSLVYIIATLWFCWRFRRDPVTWMIIPFLLVHFSLSRKDVRFLFPLLPWIPVMVLAGIQQLRKHQPNLWLDKTWRQRGVKTLWGLNLLLVAIIIFRPVNKMVHANKFIYDNYSDPVTLYADGRHVYSYFDLNINFYQRPGKITIRQTQDRQEWQPCSTNVCLYSEYTRDPNPPAQAELVYTNRPAIADHLGLTNWLDDIRWWYIYELAEPQFPDN